MRIYFTFLVVLAALLITSASHAAINDLGGLTETTQMFATSGAGLFISSASNIHTFRLANSTINGVLLNGGNLFFATSSDTNIHIRITTSTNTWTFTPVWQGTLAVSRGGLGGDFSSSTGALQINDGVVSAGVLETAKGGTGISNVYSKGDILVAVNSSTLARLPAGLDGQVLTASSSSSLGVAWVTLATSSGISKLEISDGSVKALYHLENTSDSSGNGNNLTNTGSVTFTSGKFNNAANYGDPNTTKRLNNTGYTQTGSTTISAWYKLTSFPPTGKNSLIANVGEGAGTYVYHSIYVDSGGNLHFLRQKQNVGGTNVEATTTVAADGLWHFAVYEYNASNNVLQGFLDSLSIGTSSTSGNGSSGYTGGIDLGGANGDLLGESGGTLSWMLGMTDEIAIFNKVISTSTITSLYNVGSGKEICVTAGCASQ